MGLRATPLELCAKFEYLNLSFQVDTFLCAISELNQSVAKGTCSCIHVKDSENIVPSNPSKVFSAFTTM